MGVCTTSLGFAVLDDVALVEDAVVPADAREEADVVADDLIRRDHEVVFLDPLLQPSVTKANKRCSLQHVVYIVITIPIESLTTYCVARVSSRHVYLLRSTGGPV